MIQTIKSMSNHFTPKELQLIAESISYYVRHVSGQQKYTANKLQQIFTLASRSKVAK